MMKITFALVAGLLLRERGVGEIGAGPGDATKENNAFLIGNGADCIEHRSTGRLAQQPQQARSRLGPAHPAERTGRFTRDSAIRIIEQLAQHRNDRGRGTCAAAAAGADR